MDAFEELASRTSQPFCQVTTALANAEAAQRVATSAVSARLAACAQVSGPVTSTYWWRGAVESATEWIVTFKTTVERYPALEKHLRDEHPYDVPEILCLPIVAGSPAYLDWVATETRG
jgi:periplasmic divalent cation tolerance protein